MKISAGKSYTNKKIRILSKILYNFKWIGLLLIAINFLPVLEKATSSYGLDGEYLFWGCCLVGATVLLFVFSKKWEQLCDRITDKLDK